LPAEVEVEVEVEVEARPDGEAAEAMPAGQAVGRLRVQLAVRADVVLRDALGPEVVDEVLGRRRLVSALTVRLARVSLLIWDVRGELAARLAEPARSLLATAC
jgi:hypothetical protein